MAKLQPLIIFCFTILWVETLGSDIVQNNNTDLFSFIFKENDLDQWESPKELSKAFPYYLSGYDEDCRPIWVGELGKWDLSKVNLEGPKTREAIQKYIHIGLYRLVTSLKETPDGCDPASRIVVIYDMDGFNYGQVTSTKIVTFFLNAAKPYIPIFAQYVESIYFVNANFFARGVVEMARPLLGSLMERVEVFGTNKGHWLPKLLKNLPRDQLHARYGGSADFKPIRTFG